MLLTLVSAFVGAIISRVHGGGSITGVSKTTRNLLWATPLSVVVFLCTLNYYLFAVSFVLCLVGKATGHGRVWNPYLPLELNKPPEKIELPFSWLQKYLRDFWYKSCMLSLLGFLTVSGAAICIWTVYPLYGFLIALSGLIGKPISYLIGWKLFGKRGNEIGEYGSGLFVFFVVGLLLENVIF